MTVNSFWYTVPNRTCCDVLHEMKKTIEYLYDAQQKRHLGSLIEELQTYVNRMESALSDIYDIRELHKERVKLKDEVEELNDRARANDGNKS